MEGLNHQTQPSFNDNHRFSKPINPLFSSGQISDKVHQNEPTVLVGAAEWLNTSSKEENSIEHGQCPACLRAYPIAGTSFPSGHLPAPGTAEDGYGMTSATGVTSSSSPPAIQYSPRDQYPQAQSPIRVKQPRTPSLRTKTKSKSTPKAKTRKHATAKCESCDRSFTRVYDFQRHWISQHSGEPLRWMCVYCEGGKDFCREDKLKEHLRKHHPQFNIASPGA